MTSAAPLGQVSVSGCRARRCGCCRQGGGDSSCRAPLPATGAALCRARRAERRLPGALRLPAPGAAGGPCPSPGPVSQLGGGVRALGPCRSRCPGSGAVPRLRARCGGHGPAPGADWRFRKERPARRRLLRCESTEQHSRARHGAGRRGRANRGTAEESTAWQSGGCDSSPHRGVAVARPRPAAELRGLRGRAGSRALRPSPALRGAPGAQLRSGGARGIPSCGASAGNALRVPRVREPRQSPVLGGAARCHRAGHTSSSSSSSSVSVTDVGREVPRNLPWRRERGEFLHNRLQTSISCALRRRLKMQCCFCRRLAPVLLAKTLIHFA